VSGHGESSWLQHGRCEHGVESHVADGPSSRLLGALLFFVELLILDGVDAPDTGEARP